MPDSYHRQRRPWQFGLRALFAIVALMAMLLAVVHYCLDGPEFFRLIVGITTFVLAMIAAYGLIFVAPLVAIIWLAQWNRRSAAPNLSDDRLPQTAAAESPEERENGRKIRRFFLLCLAFAALLVLLVVIPGVWCDCRDSLPNGYRIVYYSSQKAVILASQGRHVVGPHITEWTVRDHQVWGRCMVSDGQGEDAWFLLDTTTGKVAYFEAREEVVGALGTES